MRSKNILPGVPLSGWLIDNRGQLNLIGNFIHSMNDIIHTSKYKLRMGCKFLFLHYHSFP